MLTLPQKMDTIQDEGRREENRGYVTSIHAQEDEIQAEKSRPQNRENMDPAREAESELDKISRNCLRNEVARHRHRFCQRSYLVLDNYIEIGKMDRKCPHRDALHFVDERGKNPLNLLQASQSAASVEHSNLRLFRKCACFFINF